MQSDARQLIEFFSSPEGYLALLFLALGFLLGYALALLLHRARIRQLENRLAQPPRVAEAGAIEVAELQGRQADLQAALDTRDRDLQKLRDELAGARQIAQNLETEKDQLFNEIYAINAEVEKLNAAEAAYAATIDKLNQQVQELKQRNQALRETRPDQVPAAAEPHPDPAQHPDQLKKRLGVLLDQVKALREENDDLRTHLDAMPSEQRAVEPLQPFRPQPSGPAVNGTAPRDELTLIKGIGPFLKQKLNAQGILSFADLSDLDPHRVDELTQALRLVEGRIDRENWAGQARRLQAMKTDDPEGYEHLASHPADRRDLTLIEGIGPEIEGLLHEAGIRTWDDLADAPVDRLRAILRDSGSGYQMHEPGTWPIQATLAANGHWQLLEEYQDQLIGGRDMSPVSRP